MGRVTILLRPAALGTSLCVVHLPRHMVAFMCSYYPARGSIFSKSKASLCIRLKDNEMDGGMAVHTCMRAR